MGGMGEREEREKKNKIEQNIIIKIKKYIK